MMYIFHTKKNKKYEIRHIYSLTWNETHTHTHIYIYIYIYIAYRNYISDYFKIMLTICQKI